MYLHLKSDSGMYQQIVTCFVRIYRD